MLLELTKLGMRCKQQQLLSVFYDQQEVGHYFADIIVENTVIIELKAAENLCPAHEAQLVNYLRASNIEVGLLLNFGKTPQHKRRVLTNVYKNHNHS